MGAMETLNDNRVLVPLIRSRHAAAVQRVEPGEWAAIGFVEQLPELGSMLPVTIGWHGVHVMRDAEGRFRAGLNAAAAGGCFSIPRHCATTQNVRCANLGCSFSANPGVLDSRSDPEGVSRRQIRGNRPDRLLELPVERWGPLLFVSVSVEKVAEVREQLPVEDWLWDLVEGSGVGQRVELVVERTLPDARRQVLDAVDVVLGTSSGETFETGLDSAPVQLCTLPGEGVHAATASGSFVYALRPNVMIASRDGAVSLLVIQFEGANRSRVLAADIEVESPEPVLSSLAVAIIDRMTR